MASAKAPRKSVDYKKLLSDENLAAEAQAPEVTGGILAGPGSTIEPQADPGPPPPMPSAPEGVWPFGLSRLQAAAQARNRMDLQAFDCKRLPPSIGIYRAHLLEWVDAIEAYEAATK